MHKKAPARQEKEKKTRSSASLVLSMVERAVRIHADWPGDGERGAIGRIQITVQIGWCGSSARWSRSLINEGINIGFVRQIMMGR
jgi:hypothetical protein